MNYLNFRNDYLQRLPPEDLEHLLSQNSLDKEEALIDIEAMTASTLSGYLDQRYDLNGLRGKKYQQSLVQLKSWAVSIAAFLLFERAGTTPNEEVRKEYEACMALIKSIGNGERHWLAPVSSATPHEPWLAEDDLGLDLDDSFSMDLY